MFFSPTTSVTPNMHANECHLNGSSVIMSMINGDRVSIRSCTTTVVSRLRGPTRRRRHFAVKC